MKFTKMMGVGIFCLSQLGLSAAMVGCGDEAEEQRQQQEAERLAAELTANLNQAMENIPEPTAVAPPAEEAAAGQSNFGTISLAAGFTPDPHVVEGTSGGSTDARTLSASCGGFVSSMPDHILSLASASANLRVMVKSDSDTTLVVQFPDGSYHCADDDEGLNPIVAEAFAAGDYKIWVGSYTQGESASYSLGLSELPTITPASL